MATKHRWTPEDSFFAQLTSETAEHEVTIRSSQITSADKLFVKVAVPASAGNVLVKFDPVALEEARQTRQLNKSLRLGFVPPVVSTR